MGNIDWNTTYIISQIMAIVAATLVSVSFFVRKKSFILVFTLLGYSFYMVHYLLLRAYSGAIIAGLSISRGIQFYYDEKRGKKNNIFSLVVFLIALTAGGAATFRKWPDILTIFAGINTTTALWQNNVCYYRWASAWGSLFWIAYMALYRSVLGLAEEIIVFVIELVGLILFYVNKKKQNANPLPEQKQEEKSLEPANQNI